MVRTTLSLQSPARFKRVLDVQFERILLARDRRDAALRVIRVRLRTIFFRDDGHASMRRRLQRERKPRNAAAEDEVIEWFHWGKI
jgi:hypothetical protein